MSVTSKFFTKTFVASADRDFYVEVLHLSYICLPNKLDLLPQTCMFVFSWFNTAKVALSCQIWLEIHNSRRICSNCDLVARNIQNCKLESKYSFNILPKTCNISIANSDFDSPQDSRKILTILSNILRHVTTWSFSIPTIKSE